MGLEGSCKGLCIAGVLTLRCAMVRLSTSLLLHGASRINAPGSGLFPHLHAVVGLALLQSAGSSGEGRTGTMPTHSSLLCFPQPRGPKVPQLDFALVHLGCPTCARGWHSPEQGHAAGEMLASEKAANCDPVVLHRCVPPGATLGMRSTVQEARGGHKHLDCCCSHRCSRALICCEGNGGCKGKENGKGAALLAAPHGILSHCQGAAWQQHKGLEQKLGMSF